MHMHEQLTNALVLRNSDTYARETNSNYMRSTVIASRSFIMYILDICRAICGDIHKKNVNFLGWLGMHTGHNVIRQQVGLYHPNNAWILTICNDHQACFARVPVVELTSTHPIKQL